jgi:tRNA(fMet)-specific endonuclease VapC
MIVKGLILMNGKFLLDTNIIIALFANQEAINNNLLIAEEIFIPSIAIGELYYGANKSQKVQDNLAKINEFIINNIILGCDAITAKYYGQIKHSLRIKGRPLPENDIWIAAIAFQYDLILVSRDSHFQEIENLQLVQW